MRMGPRTERERWGEMGRDGERAVSEGSLRKPLLRLPPFHVVAVAAAMFTGESSARRSETGDGRNFVAFLAFKIRADGMRDEPC